MKMPLLMFSHSYGSGFAHSRNKAPLFSFLTTLPSPKKTADDGRVVRARNLGDMTALFTQ
jgi:hypothetical protein